MCFLCGSEHLAVLFLLVNNLAFAVVGDKLSVNVLNLYILDY